MHDPQIIELIKHSVKPFYAQQDPWHDYQHGTRVALLALKISQIENGNPFLVEAGAWLHQFHDHLTQLQDLLDSLPIPQTTIAELYHIVEQCRPTKISSNSTLEARIVFDADALELMGPYGTLREMLCNTVARNQPMALAVKNTQNAQSIFKEKLQTNTAKELATLPIETTKEFWQVYNFWEKEILCGSDKQENDLSNQAG